MNMRWKRIAICMTMIVMTIMMSGCGGKLATLFDAFAPEIAGMIRDRADRETVVMDNPTDASVTFKIDGKSFTLNAKESRTETLAVGSHVMEVPGRSEPITFEQKDSYRKSLVNPTGSLYIIWDEIYTNNPNSSVHGAMHGGTSLVTVNGKEYEGMYTSVKDYFVARESEQPWRWGVDEEIPDEITVGNFRSGSTYSLKYGKLYRADDFVEAHEREYGK